MDLDRRQIPLLHPFSQAAQGQQFADLVKQILFVAGKGSFSVRLLTPQECARLMGADNYKIVVPQNQALFGFGDAVCVPVIRWIAENCLTPAWEQMHAKKDKAEQYAKAM